MLWTFACLVVAAVAAAAPAPGVGVPGAPLLPANDPFYTPRAGWQATAPGTILATRNVTVSLLTLVPAPVKGYQLLYRSTDAFDGPTTTVTTGAATSQPNPVTQEQAFFQSLLLQGWIVSLSDHEGPTSAFAAGPLEGHAVLDGIRATLAFGSNIGLLPTARVVMWGYSGGAIATGWAEKLLASYAPELNVVGSAHGGTPANLQPTLENINGGANSGLLVSAAIGIASVYPLFSESLYGLATPKMKALIADNIATQCGGDTNSNNIDFFADDQYFTSGNQTLALPAWQRMFSQTDMSRNATLTPHIPLHIYHTRDDDGIPYPQAAALVKTWCANGANIEFVTNTIPTVNHIEELVYGAPAALAFLADRLDGVPFTQGCVYKYNPAGADIPGQGLSKLGL